MYFRDYSMSTTPIWMYSVGGKSYSFEGYMSTMYNWTTEIKKSMQIQRQFETHKGFCTIRKNLKYIHEMLKRNFIDVSYPKGYHEYRPSNICLKRENNTDISPFWAEILLAQFFN
jgi:hypothetical protein